MSPVVGEKLEQLVPKEESKPRSPQAQKPLEVTTLKQETPQKEFVDQDMKVYKAPKKIVREKKLSIPLKGELHKTKSKAKTLNYTPKLRKQKHTEVAPEFRMNNAQKEDIKNRIFKMRQRIGL